jgi:GNAT superfamily N-acetyltransferase
MQTEIRATTKKDIHYLLDIDLKCFEFPWTIDEWKTLGERCLGTIATVNRTPIGFVLFRSDDDGDMEIVKIAIKPGYRRHGIASRLLDNCVRFARETRTHCLHLVIPERLVYPDTPDEISGWLCHVQFQPTVPLLRDRFEYYGRLEDGIRFTLTVPYREK